MNRRDVLKALAFLAPSGVAGRVYSAPNTQARLLVVFLRGAYDAANVVIPVSSDFYYQSRPAIAIPKPGSDPNAALALDSDWALHPALKEWILPLYQKGQVAFIPFAGTDDLTRSHFETQDTIELGQPLGGMRDLRSGFLGRLVTQLNGAEPISFTEQLPLIFRGSQWLAGRDQTSIAAQVPVGRDQTSIAAQVPNFALNAIGKPGIDARQAGLIKEMYKHDVLSAAVAEGFDVRDQVYRSIAMEEQSDRNAATPKGFELAARRIGRLMREQYNLGFVDVGGWDTHVNQGGTTGYLADRLGELGRGLVGFSSEIGEQAWHDTVVIVISEFGRTFRENGDKGTDHGHGSVYWVMGGSVRGGRILGKQVKVEQTTLNENRDYPVLNEYRALFGGIFARVYGLSSERLQKVLPDTKPQDLGLI